jgi:ankyrin repeat protein
MGKTMRNNIRLVGRAVVALLATAGVAAAATDLRLVDAAKTQDTEAVRRLIKQGVPVNVSQPDGFTALHWAAERNKADMADLLIRAGEHVSAADAYGVTPLSLACTNGSVPMVEMLLKAGANPNAAHAYNETVLMTCARSGALDAVNALLARGADVNAVETSEGQTAVMWAAAEGHTEVVRALVERGADVRAHSTKGYTALLLTAREGNLETTKALLASGADVNEAAKDGTTALVVATVRGHTEYAKFLLNQGANPDKGPGFGPLHWAAGEWNSYLNDFSNGITNEDTEWSAFGGLPKAERLDFVKALLARGADPNARARRTPNYGMRVKGGNGNLVGATPFLIAAQSNDVAIMRELVSHGADPNVATNLGTTPLMVAAGIGHLPGMSRSTETNALEAVKLCLELGNDVNAVNKTRDTALHGAAWRHFADSIVQYLVDHGANMDAKNNRGWTPLVIAEGIRTGGNFVFSPSTTVLLKKLGAAPSPPDISRVPEAGEEP